MFTMPLPQAASPSAVLSGHGSGSAGMVLGHPAFPAPLGGSLEVRNNSVCQVCSTTMGVSVPGTLVSAEAQ